MSSNLSYIFSGKLLTHGQYYIQHDDKNVSFYNISSYMNKQLYTHVRKYVERKNNW